ncbi:hypothetical protein A6F68_01045 [Tsuneonella dongtanensis]|uniref:Proteinase inhibitor I42 chagasin domain-containing protein n=1 Tax=Tsuneonella dongtanensis TaxID=692370 RepID=A0A1B2ABQ2_9SPHN|nr:protease inhibitor I42 family protein [Tsuneonella dongtanensis]ANY19567.1 hypothetical protein A6F68_01045 [Tsuneonella dongtanensis]
MLETASALVMAVGSVESLDLERQGVGGYVWSIPDLPPGLELAGEPQQAAVAGGIGEGAVFHVPLRATAAGHYVIVAERRRPWGAGEPAERRTISIDVA